MKTMLLLPLFVLALSGAVIAGEQSVWTNDFEAAKAKAEKEGKDILLVFSGSDWCKECKSLEAALSKPEIADEIAKRFVPVIADFPKLSALDPRTLKQNEMLGITFGLAEVPTIIVMDTKGKAFGTIVGFSETEDFIKVFQQFASAKTDRDAGFAAASKLTGDARAAAYSDAITKLMEQSGIMWSWSNYGYDDEIAEISKSTVTAIKIPWDYRKHVILSRGALMKKDYPNAIKPLDDFVAKYPEDKEYKQYSLYAKAQIEAMSGNPAACLATLKQTVAIDPETDTGKLAKRAVDEIERMMKLEQTPQK